MTRRDLKHLQENSMPILYNLRTNLPLLDVPLKTKTLITTLAHRVPWSSTLGAWHSELRGLMTGGVSSVYLLCGVFGREGGLRVLPVWPVSVVHGELGYVVCKSDLGHCISSTGDRDGCCIQKWLLGFLRSMLGVRTSTPSWSVLRECGIEPIQFNWFRACARSSIATALYFTSFFMLTSPSALGIPPAGHPIYCLP
eukprot:1154372-Pelagomonas_calceolata.AAC.1